MTVSNMTGGNTSAVVFPDQGHQILSVLVHLLGSSVLAACFARRFSTSNMTLVKFCILAIFADSWLFVFSAGVVVSGVGMSSNAASCLSGIYLCIFFYASSKVLVYLFLAEKVHIVWSAGKQVSRIKSKVWLVCFGVLFGYLTVFVLMLVAKIGYITDDHVCIIGLRSIASISLLSYDCFLNLFLTGLFVWPLLRRDLSTQNLRNLATRTCWAAAVALATSVVNIAILTSLHGQQLGWVCLASCGFDVTVNAVVIFAVSHRNDGPTHFDAESPRAPVSSSKLVSDRTSPHVTIFKGKFEKPKLAMDSFSNVSDFAHTRQEESVMTITALNNNSYTTDMYDYLPKEQLSELGSQHGKGTTLDSERSESSIHVNRLSGSCDNVHDPSMLNVSGNKNSFISHERRRGSRGLVAEFCDRMGRNRAAVDDVAIQVTITTEHTPTNDSQLMLASSQYQQDRPFSPQPHAI